MKGLRAAFGFFSILPVPSGGAGMGLPGIAAAGVWLPVVAVVLGAAEGLAAWGLLAVFGAPVSAALVLALMLLLTGLHHADGLADLSDALMAGGDRARRLSVLKDRTTGAGAVAALIIAYLITFAALLELLGGAAFSGSDLVWLLAGAEVSARLSLILCGRVSPPSHEGSGSVFISGIKGWRGAVALALAAAALAAAGYLLPDRSLTPAAASAAAITGILLATGARRWFGGVNGDVLGASVELGRMTALLAMAAVAFPH